MPARGWQHKALPHSFSEIDKCSHLLLALGFLMPGCSGVSGYPCMSKDSAIIINTSLERRLSLEDSGYEGVQGETKAFVLFYAVKFSSRDIYCG
jgi:hypothetical protein